MPARSNISWWSSQQETTTKNLLPLLKHDAAEVFLVQINESCLETLKLGSIFDSFVATKFLRGRVDRTSEVHTICTLWKNNITGWKIHRLKMDLRLKRVMFRCYVRLMECNLKVRMFQNQTFLFKKGSSFFTFNDTFGCCVPFLIFPFECFRSFPQNAPSPRLIILHLCHYIIDHHSTYQNIIQDGNSYSKSLLLLPRRCMFQLLTFPGHFLICKQKAPSMSCFICGRFGTEKHIISKKVL